MSALMLPPAQILLSLSICWGCAMADVYMNNPRGSNNKLSEQSNNVQNDNRLFDSQNNDASGYQIGDKCLPVCQDENGNYDETRAGAMQGVMTYYQGSELYIEWLAQHGCGAGHPNVRCQFILQYMSESDNGGLRDGTKRGNQNTAGGQQEPPEQEDADDRTLGQHEPLPYYLACKARERNKGLYTADQQVRDDRGATATRQNPNGNGNANQRHGLECPEERDYYPYWHPTPWHDIAVLTDDPQGRCDYYVSESQNVRSKGICSEPEFNNPKACDLGGGVWSEVGAFNEPPPECVGGMQSRDNHNGNVRNGRPMYYVWRLPEYLRGRVVLRLRYNITTMDFEPGSVATRRGVATEDHDVEDPFFVDESFNDRDPSTRRRTTFQGGPPILANDPQADWIGLDSSGDSRVLQLQVNTDQVARTFEDRTHTFIVQERPDDIPMSTRIVNYNVRGRRGNIVQVYPSVEYDFVPQEVTVEAGTYLHFQWTGSDANAKNNAGNGRKGTDRSNLVQVAARGENVPLPLSQHTLFFNAKADPHSVEGRSRVDRFAYLDQDSLVTCDAQENDDQARDNCKQLNGASAYFDGGLVMMTEVGTHHIASTRNNDFSNRSQKATIHVLPGGWKWYSILAVTVVALLFLVLAAYFGAAFYAFKRPTSWLFSKRYRPRILRFPCLVKPETLQSKIDERNIFMQERRKQWMEAQAAKTGAAAPGTKGTGTQELDMSKPWEEDKGWTSACLRRSRSCGLHEQRLFVAAYAALNAIVFLIGFFSHMNYGFQSSLAYPFAKGSGYTLDLNFAMLVLPTLKSLQTALRSAGATREWIPIDDPISFHIVIAVFILLGTIVHVVSHVVHMEVIATAPKLQKDPLDLWILTEEEKISGTGVGEQLVDFRSRCAGVTGIVLAVLMALMFLTALPCARRGTNALTRRLGGYNLFWRVHLSWKWIYVLLLLHCPTRLWIWLLFPAILVLMDRTLLKQRQRPYAALRQAKLLPRDVLNLTFDVPAGFAYQAGQYVLLGWRNEWHPFTLTSAPEERKLSLHIRSPQTLDWCAALRKRLLVEAPAATSGKASEAAAPTEKTCVEYVTQKCIHSQVLYSQPKPTVTGKSGGRASTNPSANANAPDLERADSFDSISDPRKLPDDAVVLQLSGPFGAPAQKVWQFDTIMAVGAGIGVTPFASILRSVQIRAKQRQAIQGAMNASSRDRKLMSSALGEVDQLLQDVVTVPTRIYFFWIVRNQEELDWFSDLLAAAVEGPARHNINVSVFVTGEVELAQVKKLPFVQHQFFGRPSWSRIFKQKKEEHKGEHIGVFLCGAPAVGKELSQQSVNHTDPPGQPNSTRFSFFKEHF